MTVWAANHLQVNLFLLPGQRSDGRACSDKFKYSGEAAVALLISNDLVKCRPKESPLFRHAEQSRPFFYFFYFFFSVERELYCFFPTRPLFARSANNGVKHLFLLI